MPLTVSNPRDLLLVTLGDLLFVERMLASDVLPDLLKEVSDPELGGALAEHLEETKRHVEGVVAAFRALDAEASANHSKPFVGLKEQHATVASSIRTPLLADLWHAQAAAHTEHYEIAGYTAAIGLARALGVADAVAALEPILEQERRALELVEGAAAKLQAGV
jgi:ferritin-like metal-binding protein YciE